MCHILPKWKGWVNMINSLYWHAFFYCFKLIWHELFMLNQYSDSTHTPTSHQRFKKKEEILLNSFNNFSLINLIEAQWIISKLCRSITIWQFEEFQVFIWKCILKIYAKHYEKKLQGFQRLSFTKNTFKYMKMLITN